jgi:hypothetical protein
MFSAATKTGSQPSAAYNYIEDVFSTYLYTGNSGNQTINNGIDLAGKGGMVWLKCRSQGGSPYENALYDTVRGVGTALSSNLTSAQVTSPSGREVSAFNSNGFNLGPSYNYFINYIGDTEVSWTFRKQAKFFDIVTYTGTGANTTISHNLGSVPGMIIVKRTDTPSNWQVYSNSLANTEYLVLNTTAAKATGATRWNSTTPTSTVFSIGTDATVNASGGTYVAYIFASNAGGFGTTGTDNVISCGSFTSDSSGGISPVNLGYEPQWLMVKNISSAGDGWRIVDVMRGWSQTQMDDLSPNDAGAERVLDNNPSYLSPTATGFSTPTPGIFTPSKTFIYVAIRRPMKVPTDATKVFSPVTYTGNGTTQVLTTGFTVDAEIVNARAGGQAWQPGFNDRLRGNGFYLTSSNTNATGDYSAGLPTEFNSNTAVNRTSNFYNYDGGGPGLGYTYVTWTLARRPGFFDVVICKQTGSAQDVTHNLGVAPELLILKDRTSAVSWQVGAEFTSTTWNNLVLNSTDAGSVGGYNNYVNAQPTSTVFRLGANLGSTNDSFVAYLFATCAGVSKVGTYTGNGSTQAISCGFTGGARFVLIKRTDSTGDWYVYDTARGMTTLTDPYLLLNSTAAESATLGSVTTTAGGFTINAAVLAAINTSSASYIFLAIA